MDITTDRETRRKQREILKAKYPDYDARRHDAFVIRFNEELDRLALENYMRKRGIQ